MASKCNGCGNPTTYDSGFKQECATEGCVNFRFIDPIAVAARRAELDELYPEDDDLNEGCDNCGNSDRVEDEIYCQGCLNSSINIDGDVYFIDDTDEVGYNVVMATMTDGTEWYLADDTESAGEVCRERWADMAANDPTEFACMVGEATIIAWGMGQMAGPGCIQVSSLDEWLDLVADHPEEELASYDDNEGTVTDVAEWLSNELGFTPTVAYRHN